MTTKTRNTLERLMNYNSTTTRDMIDNALRTKSSTYDELAGRWARMSARWGLSLLEDRVRVDVELEA